MRVSSTATRPVATIVRTNGVFATSTARAPTRRAAASSSVSAARPATPELAAGPFSPDPGTNGTNCMWQIGQCPGESETTCRCIGQR